MKLFYKIVFILFLIGAPAMAAPLVFPALTGQIVDNAHILNAQTKQILQRELNASPYQVVVVTLPTLQGREIEEYGYQLGRFWGIGEKELNNGALLIIAPNEKSVRIEVGYGLEGALTDAMANLIINQGMMPYLKQGDYNTATLVGVEGILKTIKGEAYTIQEIETDAQEGGIAVLVILFLIAIYVLSAPKGKKKERLMNVFMILMLLGRGGGRGG
ncbi:MAG: TPM domain-containing protein, partial [Lactobacillales bacterium]|nr:TPM domain-containing protein [Lactobacillales bacterium]